MKFFALIKDFNLLFFKDRSSKLFALATIIGLSFSISIILCTLGLMDGFSKKMREALNLGHGEIVLTSYDGFFKPDNNDFKDLKDIGVENIAYVVRTQSFATVKSKGKAVFVLGIDEAFSKISKEFPIPKPGEIVIGKSLSEGLTISKGDSLALSFAAGRSGEKYLPNNASLKIKDIIHFKIHNFDERFVYANMQDVQKFIGISNLVNVAKLKLNNTLVTPEKISGVVEKLRSIFLYEYRVMPYWSEFATFLRAVEFEKYMISIILSIVVIIAAFNCLAFIIYSKEKKAKEIFLLFAIGLSPKKFQRLWIWQNSFIWFLSFALALLFVEFFSYAMANWDMFALPSDVYYLGRVEVDLALRDILIVMAISFVFIQSLTWLVLKRLDAKSLATGLREEFS